MEPIFEDIPGAARALKCSRAQVYKFFDSGELVRVKMGSKALVTVKSIKALAAKLIAA